MLLEIHGETRGRSPIKEKAEGHFRSAFDPSEIFVTVVSVDVFVRRTLSVKVRLVSPQEST
jgi:hypothetical protein